MDQQAPTPAVHQDATGGPYCAAITGVQRGPPAASSLGHIPAYLEAQPHSYEVVVNDDGSADATADVVRDFARRFLSASGCCRPA